MPSVNSSSRPSVWPSSTFTTPSLPTFSIASAITSPISRSREETVATRAMSSLPETLFDCDFRFSTTESTAVSMPRLRPIGFAPAATFFRPTRTIAWAWTVAVVVPSPATSVVGVGASRTGRTARADHVHACVRLADDQVLVHADLDLGAAVRGEVVLVALLQVDGDELPAVAPAARAHSQHTPTLRLLLGRVLQHAAAPRHF